MNDTKLDPADLNSPHPECFVRPSLELVVALTFPWQINVSCASTGGAIQL